MSSTTRTVTTQAVAPLEHWSDDEGWVCVRRGKAVGSVRPRSLTAVLAHAQRWSVGWIGQVAVDESEARSLLGRYGSVS